jgi:demethylmenaquinone methyltransferase/2-methoxy-6-polyprenyl-1,4-benzoquinol methylase
MAFQTTLTHYYARRAKEYEEIYQRQERQEDLRQLRERVKGTFAGKDVLEIACGTGYWTETLADCAASVTATDVSEQMLAIARAKQMDPHRVSLSHADAYALPGFKRHFNAGLAGFFWSHVPKGHLTVFLNDFHRSFLPHATIMFIDNLFVEGSSTPISRRDGEGNTWQMRRLQDGSTHEVPKNFPTGQEIQSALTGLAKDVKIEFLKYYWVLTYKACHPDEDAPR